MTARPAGPIDRRGRRSMGVGVPWLGSIFGKTLRDSIPATVLAVGLLIFMTLTGGAAIAAAFGTADTRRAAAALATTLPTVFQGLLGRPVGLESLGGLLEWRYSAVTFLLIPIWSILALSSTLAREARDGSLELVLSSAVSRRRVALEKLAAHLAAVAVMLATFSVVLWLTGRAFGTLPGDEIPVRACLAYAALAAVLILVPGAIAFGAAPFVGRGPAATLAGIVMVAAYLVNGFRSSIAVFDSLAPLSWYSWTTNHVPLAGAEDWPSLAGPAVLVVVLLTVGVVAFERRDIGTTIAVPTPHLPAFLVGLRGPMGRSFAERIPAALTWGVALGLYALALASAVPAMADLFRQLPVLAQMMRVIYPHLDLESVGGLLQITFVEMAFVVFGFATATIVAGWASDETERRLEEVLSTPLSRAAWLVRSGLGAYLAILLSTTIVALATGVGAALEGSEIATPAIGTFVLAFYGLAWAGVGIAAGGIIRAAVAGPVVAILTVATFLVSIFAAPLKLPDWVGQLALTGHYGMPLVGSWDALGLVASVALAVGGLAVGVIGLLRRDVRL